MNRFTRAIQKMVTDPDRQEFFIESIENRYGFTNLKRIRIESASACNLRCLYCPTGTDYNNPRIVRQIMPAAVFDRIVDQIKDFPTLTYATMYFGGEPLLNKDLLPNIQRLLNETTIKNIQLVTNGMLITEDFCRQMSAIENADSFTIEVSIDGKLPADNNLCRRGSDYEQIKNNVIMMRKTLPAKFQVQIANVQVPTVDEVYSDPVVPAYLKSDFAELRKGTFGPFGIAPAWAQVWPGLEPEYLASQGYRKQPLLKPRPCVFPIYEVSIRANGDIVPCCYDLKSEQVMGKICEKSLKEVLDSQPYRKLREALVQYYAFGETHYLPDICRRCVLILNELISK